MKTQIIRADSRGHLNHGWLDTYHTFSFGDYFDRRRMNFGALRVLNDDNIAPLSMFPTHPHNNMEIITIVLDGLIEHQDSIGNKTQIKTGEIQVMSAGSGIYHSEANPSTDKTLNLFQIWILPKLHNIQPRYSQQDFNKKLQLINKWHNLVAPQQENDELIINQDAYITMGQFDNTTSEYLYELKNPNNGLFIMLIDGSITLGDETLIQRDAICIENTSNVNFKLNTTTSKLLAIEVPLKW